MLPIVAQSSSSRLLTVLAAGVLSPALFTPAVAATLWVSATGSNVSTCGGASAPCRTIQFAVDRAANGDTVRVRPGIYRENVSLTRRITLLSDAFATSGDRAATVIDCGGVCDRASGRYHPPVFAGDGCTVTGFTIRNAGGTGIEAAGSVTITYNTITGNSGLSTSHGGGINFYSSFVYSSTAPARIENNEVFANSAPAQGGGVFVRARSRADRGLRPIVIQNNNIHHNSTVSPQGSGAGLFVRLEGLNGGHTDVVITQNTISGNTNTAAADPVYYSWGGGLSAEVADYGNHRLEISNNTFESNRAGVGGGVALLTGTNAGATSVIEFVGNAVRLNTARDASGLYGFGGGLFGYSYGWGSESIVVEGNEVSGNVSRLIGGGIDVRSAPGDFGAQSVTVRDNVVAANRADDWGGGIFAALSATDAPASATASVAVLDNVVSSNSAAGVSSSTGEPLGRGGGVYTVADAARSSAPGLSFAVRGNRILSNLANLAGGGLNLSAHSSSLADVEIPGSTPRAAMIAVRAENNLLAGNVVASPDAADFPGVGGGVFVYVGAQGQASASVLADFNTVAANVSDVGAGGIEIESETEFDLLGHHGAAVIGARNSIVTSNSGFGVGGPLPGQPGVITGGGTGNLATDFRYDNVHANTEADFEPWIVEELGLQGNLSVDPRFLDPAAFDYRLSAISPLIDAGTEAFLTPPATDFEGDPRIVDGNGDGFAAPDLGWDEYAQSDPVADAGPDGTFACDVPSGGMVVLDGAGSADADSSSGTHDDIVLFEWIEHYGLPEATLLGRGESLSVVLALGPHVVTLRVVDSFGSSDTDELEIVVVDPDGDAACGFADNCPAASNPGQADNDGDGIGDACDIESCDALDNDGDGAIDEGLGSMTCGLGACRRTVSACQNGGPGTCVAGVPSTEVCNGVDDDCDGLVDEGLGGHAGRPFLSLCRPRQIVAEW